MKDRLNAVVYLGLPQINWGLIKGHDFLQFMKSRARCFTTSNVTKSLLIDVPDRPRVIYENGPEHRVICPTYSCGERIFSERIWYLVQEQVMDWIDEVYRTEGYKNPTDEEVQDEYDDKWMDIRGTEEE